ncbi:hypothetical protein HDU87_002528 [Geranomyces variabilis]|uniref:Uncharacterized protein n=1 Tax=Geranomyces variabilis TaxID=109894 RepID=A0AAD5TU85_9FUNG|nr:hypothetical protein HDU87_002528 [Geranomyces variabilis]
MHSRGIIAGPSMYKPYLTEYAQKYSHSKTPAAVLGGKGGSHRLGGINSKGQGSTLLEKRGRSHLMHDKACKAGAAAVLATRTGKKLAAPGVVVRGMSEYKRGKEVVLPPLSGSKKAQSPPHATGSSTDTATAPAAAARQSKASTPPKAVPQYQTSLILPGMIQPYNAAAVLGPIRPAAPAPTSSSNGNNNKGDNSKNAPANASSGAYTAQSSEKGFRPGPPAKVGYGENRPRYDIITGYPLYGEPYSGYKEGCRAVIETFQHMDAVANARSSGYNIITGNDAMRAQPSLWPQTRDIVAVKGI